MKTTMTLCAAALALALPTMAQEAAPSGTAAQAGAGNASGNVNPNPAQQPQQQPEQQQQPSAAAPAAAAPAAPVPAATSGGIDTGSQQLFQMLDANQDGSLSRDEFLRLPALSGGKMAPTGAGTPNAAPSNPSGNAGAAGGQAAPQR